MPEEPIDDGLEGGSKDGISRRRMLKRIGAAGAVAWATPVISSLTTPAFAQTVSPGACPAWNCGDPITECGGEACPEASGLCVCDDDVDGRPFCWNDFYCFDVGAVPCETNADCANSGPGWRCTSNCCGQTCAPPCGVCGGADSRSFARSAVAGRTGSGR